MKVSGDDFSAILFLIFPLISLITGESDSDTYSSLSDVSYKLNDVPVNGTVAAFGDFDSDQQTDVFFIVNEGHGVQIYLTHKGDGGNTKTANIQRNESITSVVPGDYDGNSHMDILITTRPNGKALDKTTPTSAYVYWGTSYGVKNSNVTEVSTNMLDQPLVMDYNADMIPDLFGAEMDGQRYFWTVNFSSDAISFSKIALTGDHITDPLRVPNSHAFVDVNNDLAADLFVTSVSAEGVDQFEVWNMEAGLQEQPWEFSTMQALPAGTFEHIGQSSFADIDADGRLDHILPVCVDAACKDSRVYASVYDKNTQTHQWIKIMDASQLTLDNKQWGFVSPSQVLSNIVAVELTLRVGDVNLDNLPDFVCILQQSDTTNNRKVVVLQNLDGGTLEPAWPNDDVSSIKGPVIAALIDYTNTGLLDIIVTSQPTPDSTPRSYLLENQFSIDAYFVTVQVLSGFVCSGTDCPNGKYTYGVNQPGATIHYDTTSSNGGRQKSIAAQICQSSYLSLQLPTVVMGLGQNPNFVDYLTVGLQATTKANGKTTRQRTFTAVIPNSHLIVIPKPLDKPEQWMSKLLITPSQAVVITGGVLVGTCVFIAVIAAILHFREKREDDVAKRQEAHRFHFDAM